MALPTSTNNVTVRKLSSTLQGIWNKITTAISGKADKVSGATNNNFASLDANGNLKDSGHKHSDYASSTQGSKADSAIQGVKVNGSALTPDSNNVVDVTKSGLGLGNVTNDAQVKRSEMGVANGVATLGSDGKVPSAQLPSFVDDVIEGYYYNSKFYRDSEHTEEITPAAGIIYVDLPTNKTYRWGGTAYVVISDTLALGETSSTAYRGDRGKTAYDHSQLMSGNPHNVTKDDVGLGNVANTGDSDTPVSGGTTKFTTGGAYTELNKKADKVSGATNNNFAALDANGNLKDSGKKASDFADSSHTHTTVIATDSGTPAVTLAANTTYALTAGGTTVIFKTPPDNNTTYTNPKLGHGYASSTAGTSPAFTAAISNYTLNGGNGGIIAIKFSANVPANATLNVNSTGAKDIYWKGAKITAGVIQQNDTAVMQYDGTRYQLLGTDRSVQEMTDQEVTDLIDALT